MLEQKYLLDRRRALAVGVAGVVGSGLPNFGASKAAAEPRDSSTSARAKSVLIVMLSGGPSQLDTLDPKPKAPAEIRGEFSPISTAIPGISVCEHLPRLAMQMDRWAILRTMAQYMVHQDQR